jgi:LPS export ABC transporter protein LptC
LKKKKWRNIPVKITPRLVQGGMLPCIALFFLLFAACNEPINPADNSIKKEDTQVEIAKEVEILYSDSAKVKVNITAKTMRRYTEDLNPRQEFPDGVFVRFYDAREQPTSTMQAKFGERSDRNYRILVRDSVIWQSANKERLETAELIWDEQKARVFTNKFVRLSRAQETILGYGFEADQNFYDWKIKTVTGRIKTGNLGKQFE